MNFIHPYSRFGLAYLMYAEQIQSVDEVTKEMLLKHLKIGLGHFRMRTKNNPETDDILKFEYIGFQEMIDSKINDTNELSKKGIYLCPNVLTTDFNSKTTWQSLVNMINIVDQTEFGDLILKRADLTTGLVPISGKFNNGGKGQSYPKASLFEIVCCAISSTTPYKPCLAYKEVGKNGTSFISTAIIPDLEIKEMVDFIELFNKISSSQLKENILSKKVYREKPSNNKASKKKKIEANFTRPKIFDGNFPDAPKSFALGCVGLLGAIGKWAEEAKETLWAGQVLDSLKGVSLYLIKYGEATSVTFNHYIIDLAKENKLNQIVNAVYFSEIISVGRRPYDFREESKTKYPLYDMFSSRFLQLFDKPSFKDFLSIRTEYKPELEKLFTLYFEKIMSIRPEIVSSAKELGLWLNYVAYKAAKEETKDKTFDDLKKAKAKHLVEIESSALSAKRPTALLAQTITRAGRLSGMDAPEEADEFMQATSNGEISLDIILPVFWTTG
ncbi:MAG: hypothetical protein WCY77_12225 [Weeksellaceae bacterium]